jgi:uncharacterized protein YoxC
MINIPSNAPSWVFTIYWMVFAIGMVLVILVPVVIKAYVDIHTSMDRVRKSSSKLQSSADAAAINSALTAHKIDSLAPGPHGASPEIMPVLPMDSTDTEIARVAKEVQTGGK